MGRTILQSRECERRLRPRRVVTGPQLVPIEAGAAKTGGLILDISSGGAAMQLLGEVQPHGRHSLSWQFSPQESWIEVQGEVVWAGANHTYGVRFVSVPEQARASISDWLAGQNRTPVAPPARPTSSPTLAGDDLIGWAELAQNLLNAEGATIAVPKGREFVCISSAGIAPQPGTALRNEYPLFSECLQAHNIVCCSDLAGDPRCGTHSQDRKFASMLVAPVTFADHVIGVLACGWTRRHEFNSRDIKALSSIAEVNPHSRLPLNEVSRPGSPASAATATPTAALRRAAGNCGLDHVSSPPVCTPAHRVGNRLSLRVILPLALCLGSAIAIGWYGHDWITGPPRVVFVERAATEHPVPHQAPQKAPRRVPNAKLMNRPSAELQKTDQRQSVSRTAPAALGSAPLRSDIPHAGDSLQSAAIHLPKFGNNQDGLRKVLAVDAFVPKVTPGSSPEAHDGARRLSQPVPILKVQPHYPPAARSARSGTVTLYATVDVKGTVTQVRVVGGDPVLAQAASAAVLHWRYKPAELDGRKVEAEVLVIVSF